MFAFALIAAGIAAIIWWELHRHREEIAAKLMANPGAWPMLAIEWVPAGLLVAGFTLAILVL